MNSNDLNWIANYIWGIADDVLRDLYVRGKYRDVILPMTVLRRLDAVLEDTKQAVLDMKSSLDMVGVVEQDPALRQAAGQAFYNTSKFTLRDLRSPRQPPAAHGRLPSLPRRLFSQRPGHSRQLRIPQPDSTVVQGRCLGDAHRETHFAWHQSESLHGHEGRWFRAIPRARQPRDGVDLRRAGSALQRGKQRGGR